jgi:hypothetical protein
LKPQPDAQHIGTAGTRLTRLTSLADISTMNDSNDFTMYPATPANIEETTPRPVGALVSGITGAFIVAVSVIYLIFQLTTPCFDVACDLGVTMNISFAGFGIFFGSMLIVLGMWSASRAAARAAARAEEITTWK